MKDAKNHTKLKIQTTWYEINDNITYQWKCNHGEPTFIQDTECLLEEKHNQESFADRKWLTKLFRQRWSEISNES